MMTTSKLPEWPEKPMRGEGSVSVSFEHVAAVQAMWLTYNEALVEAALARMEALVEFAEHPGSCSRWRHHDDGGSTYSSHRACDCGLSELLAACARKEAGR